MRKTLFRWIAVLLCAALSLPGLAACGGTKDTSAYRAKVDLLKTEVLTETTAWELGLDPAGDAGYAVFLSVCDVQTRADVFSGTGATLEEAWEAADRAAESALAKSGRSPVWMKADLVFQSEKVTYEDLCQSLSTQRPGSVRFGVSFDDDFENALLEVELNAAGAFRCGEEDAGKDSDHHGQLPVKKLPVEQIIHDLHGGEDRRPRASDKGERAEREMEPCTVCALQKVCHHEREVEGGKEDRRRLARDLHKTSESRALIGDGEGDIEIIHAGKHERDEP